MEPPVKDERPINEMIKAPEVRLIGAEGEQIGVVSREDALDRSANIGLDLVIVADNASPPVCKIMDYGKFKYQQSKRQHAAKVHQKVIHVKEVKLRPKIEDHDLQFKVRNALRFLEDGDKVKVNVVFMGREMAHKDLGLVLIERFQNMIGENGIVEQPVRNEGRSMFMILAPPKKK